jgi:ATP-binding cassette, subfamily B, bacterial
MSSSKTLVMPKTALGFFIHIALKFKQPLILAALGCCAFAFENTAFPYASKLIIEAITKSNPNEIYQALKNPVIVLVAIWLGNDIMWRLAGFSIANFRSLAEAYVKECLNIKFLEQNSVFFQKYQSGDLFGRTMHSSSEIPFLFEHTLYHVVPCVLNVAGVLLLSSFVNTAISGVIFTWVFIHFLIAYIFFKKNIILSAKYAQSSNIFHGSIKDSLSNNQNVRIFNGLSIEKAIFRVFSQKQKNAQKDMLYMYQYMLFIMAIVSFVFNGLILIYILAKSIQNGSITAGDVTMIFFLVKNLSSMVFETTITLGEIIQTYGVIKKNYSFVKDLNQLKIQERNSNKSPSFPNHHSGEIDFNNVNFAYNSHDIVFKNFCLKIPKHQKLGIVGNSGSGKSTLTNLLIKDLNPSSGSISISEIDLLQINQSEIMEHIGYIPQSPILFNRTILENIKYAKPDATIEEVIDVAKKVKIHDEVMKMGQQYDSYVGELGSEISGGQRQRIAIARALLRNTEVIIFDEATSALDIECEIAIKEVIQTHCKEKTVIVIAHKISSVAFMDRIIVMKNGEIVEDGSPKCLTENKDGFYSNMIDQNAKIIHHE